MVLGWGGGDTSLCLVNNGAASPLQRQKVGRGWAMAGTWTSQPDVLDGQPSADSVVVGASHLLWVKSRDPLAPEIRMISPNSGSAAIPPGCGGGRYRSLVPRRNRGFVRNAPCSALSAVHGAGCMLSVVLTVAW